MDQFWKSKTLQEMTPSEWESLCDGCGKCCSHKLLDEETEEVFFTSITCKLFNPLTCQCSNYSQRLNLVPACLKITANDDKIYKWLPTSCSYRLLHEGKDLPDWHHLISGDKELVHSTGHSVKGRVIFEEDLDEDEEIEDFICLD